MMFFLDVINCLIWQGSEEADKDKEWNPGNDSDSGSDPDSEAEEDYDYEDEKSFNLLNGPSPVRLAAV